MAWPSGKAGACKASIPSSNLGATFISLPISAQNSGVNSHVLILVATPIGNLDDLSFRAVKTMQEADMILCEDTRHSGKLLHHYEIKVPLKSYHKFNEAEREEELILLLHEGKQIVLISDAGTPGISDPGSRLVARCRKEGIEVTAVPGACAAIQALVISGLPTDRFEFIGFLEKKEGALRRTFAEMLHFRGTSIAYESPHRLVKSLQLLAEMAPEVSVAVGRELTKRYEEIDLGSAKEMAERWKKRESIKGELVLLIGPHEASWIQEEPQEHVRAMEKELGLTRKEAVKLVAELRGMGKRELYQKGESS